MKITSVEPILLSVPFTDGSAGEGIMPGRWSELDFCLIRVETDNGLTGWGEAFSYFCKESVAAMVKRSIAPQLTGKTVTDPETMVEEIQRAMVLQGRHGVSSFAQSGVEIALWDLVAKAEQVSLATIFSEKQIRSEVPAYASLVRYADSDLVARYSEETVGLGFPELKLHEVTLPEIRSCHAATGGAVPVSVDVNCNWSEAFSRDAIAELRELNTSWLEEPTFPPEDFRTLARLRGDGLPIATGENACTSLPFSEMIHFDAADILQPSVTKIGGIGEFRKVCRLVEEAGLTLMPHSPYFGPGYLASLQLAAIEPDFTLFEYLYLQPDSWLYPDIPLPENGRIPIPEGIGLGMDPDPAILEAYSLP